MIAIVNLRALISDDSIIAKLKQSKRYTEFEEQVRDIIDTYDRKPDHIPLSIKEIHKLTTIPIVEAKLKELEKWGEKTTRIDSSSPWQNIIDIIKDSANTQEIIDKIQPFASSIPIQNEKQNVFKIPQNKSFFSSFSSPLKTVYDFGIKSFNIIKNTSSILSSKITETFNFVNNKALSYFGIKAEETFENLSDDQLVKEIINTPEEELDTIFEKMTYEKLAELINNVSYATTKCIALG